MSDDLLLFGDLLYGLRKAGLKVGTAEWMDLMMVLQDGIIRPELGDLYLVARSLLVKSEADFDVYDQVFAAVFTRSEFRRRELQSFLRSLNGTPPPDDVEETNYNLEGFRKRFEARVREQKDPKGNGLNWLSEAKVPVFGRGGSNGSGVRGGGGGRHGVQLAMAREFRAYRSDRVLEMRDMAVALKKLRRLERRSRVVELDVEASIQATGRQAGELTLEFSPPRRNEARVLLLMDVGGSMDPYSRHVERLFSAAYHLEHWRHFEAYAFHNCIYDRLDATASKGSESIDTLELLRERPSDTYVIIVGDAYMAPSELTDQHGSLTYGHRGTAPGLEWLHRVRSRFPRSVWLNPVLPSAWHGWSIAMIREVFPMFPLTLQGLTEAIDHLVQVRPGPPKSLRAMFPDLPELWSNGSG